MPAGFQPRRPVGTTGESRFMQWVWDRLVALRFFSTETAPFETLTTGVKATARRGRGGGGGTGARFYPLKIYPSPAPPDAWWTTPNPGPGTAFLLTVPGGVTHDTWRFFRVRAGAAASLAVSGTDGGGTASHSSYAAAVSPNVDPDNTGVPAWAYGTIDFPVTMTDPAAVFTAPTGIQGYWYVWLDCTNPLAPIIGKGDTPPAAVGAAPPYSWAGSEYSLIGTIDCQTNWATKKSVIRQVRRQDAWLFTGCDAQG